MKRTIFAAFLLLVLPVVASAQTTADLQLQAQALMQKITQLQAQLGTQNSNSALPYGSTDTGATPVVLSGAQGAAIDSSTCPLIGRPLHLGISGDDVLRLQQYLARDPAIYPEANFSGYYGALTEAAVKRWQVKYNIVASGTAAATGYGVVGPRTAAAIALLCSTSQNGGGTGSGATNSNTIVGGYMTIAPVAGNAPLDVQVQAVLNTTGLCSAPVYILNWGDGTQPQQIAVPAGNCTQVAQAYTHTYQYGGSYKISLSSGAHGTNAVVTVFGAGQVSTGGGGSGGTGGGSTGSAYGPLSVTPGVNGNAFAVNVSFDVPSCASYSVNWGDGTQGASATNSCVGGSSSVSTQTASHTYGASGVYTITVSRNARQDTASVTVSQ